ncbi:MAG: hypothetical protein HQ567_07705, partial [Candidatus Nealsonbacteria bacterium]|nr:hypothetical protein [Candidatus Nealsonbacteria bacterium]
MASPFKVFRKNQKAALAVLGVLVIVGFVILPALLEGQGSRGGYKNPVVVETSEFGDLKQSDIEKLLNRRQAAIRFARNVGTQVVRLGGEGRAVSQFLRRIGDEPTEERVVRTWLLTRRAQQAGIIISKDVINNFIEQLTERRIDTGELQGILSNINVSDTLLFDVLHDELLAREMEFEMRSGLVGSTPGQRWEYFQRLNRQTTVEVIPVAVTDYVSKVTQKPGSGTLEEFFDEAKDRDPNPNSPKWGFRRPKRVSLRYFKADIEKFTDIDAVTDEEIKTAYEEDKENWDARAASLAPLTPPDDEKKPDDAGKPDDDAKPDNDAAKPDDNAAKP